MENIIEPSSKTKAWLSKNPSLAIFLLGIVVFVLGAESGANMSGITAVGLFVLIVGLAGLLGVKKVAEKARLRGINLASIDSMPGEDFERFLLTSFEISGYVVNHIGGRGDFGADLILTRDGVATVVQAKRSMGTIGPGAIQEAAAARAHYGADNALVVTNSTFTPGARSLARSNQVELWDRTDLIREIGVLSKIPPLIGIDLLKSQLLAGIPRLVKKIGLALLILIASLVAVLSVGKKSGKRRRRRSKKYGLFS